MGTTSFNLGSNEKRTRVPSSTGMSSSGMTKGNGYVSAMQLPPIPVSSFMDSFEGQERSSLDLPPIPATKGYGSAIRTTQGSERRPHVLSHQQSDDTISDTIKSTQFNYGMSRKLDSNSKASSRQSIFNSTGTTSSTSSPDRLPTSRGLAQHRSSASSVRTSNTDQRSELGAGRRPPPGRLDLDSHNKISSSSVKTRASNSTDTAHRRIVTEPTQSVSSYMYLTLFVRASFTQDLLVSSRSFPTAPFENPILQTTENPLQTGTKLFYPLLHLPCRSIAAQGNCLHLLLYLSPLLGSDRVGTCQGAWKAQRAAQAT
jgi:hypothetical protein